MLTRVITQTFHSLRKTLEYEIWNITQNSCKFYLSITLYLIVNSVGLRL